MLENLWKKQKMRNLIDTKFWGYFGKKFALMMNIKPFALPPVLWLQWWVRNHPERVRVVPWRSIRCDRAILVVHQRRFFVYRCERREWFSQHRRSKCDLPHQTARNGRLVLSSCFRLLSKKRVRRYAGHLNFEGKTEYGRQKQLTKAKLALTLSGTLRT